MKKFSTKMLLAITLAASMLTGFVSCDKEEPVLKRSNLEVAQEVLNDTVVLYTHAFMANEEKTYVGKDKRGCPVKFYFKWDSVMNESGAKVIGDSVTITMIDFTVGAMPFAVSFRCKAEMMGPNKWDTSERGGDGWIKFIGEKGYTGFNGEWPTEEQRKDAKGSIIGFFDAKTQNVSMEIDFNSFAVTARIDLQKVHPEYLKEYDKRYAEFEEALEDYKFLMDQNDVSSGNKRLSAEDLKELKSIIPEKFIILVDEIRVVKDHETKKYREEYKYRLSHDRTQATHPKFPLRIQTSYYKDKRGYPVISLKVVDDPILDVPGLPIIVNSMEETNLNLTYWRTYNPDNIKDSWVKATNTNNIASEDGAIITDVKTGKKIGDRENTNSKLWFDVNLKTKRITMSPRLEIGKYGTKQIKVEFSMDVSYGDVQQGQLLNIPWDKYDELKAEFLKGLELENIARQ